MSERFSTRLVVSVRSPGEVESAIRGGADLLDVKEPRRGSLGAAEVGIVRAVLQQVQNRVPVSAALGEWRERSIEAETEIATLPLQFVKWGLSGCGSQVPPDLIRCRESFSLETRIVLVAYADWQFAESPPPEAIIRAAHREGFSTILLDTFDKSRGSLLSHFSIPELQDLVERIHSLHLSVVLAGSLTREAMMQLVPLRPDWFAVRGAACEEGFREATISESRVHELSHLLHSSTRAEPR